MVTKVLSPCTAAAYGEDRESKELWRYARYSLPERQEVSRRMNALIHHKRVFNSVGGSLSRAVSRMTHAVLRSTTVLQKQPVVVVDQWEVECLASIRVRDARCDLPLLSPPTRPPHGLIITSCVLPTLDIEDELPSDRARSVKGYDRHGHTNSN